MIKHKQRSSQNSFSSVSRPSSVVLPSIVAQNDVSYTYMPDLPVYFEFFENDRFISMLKEQINTTYKVQIEYVKGLVENRLVLTGPQQYVEAATKEIHNLFKLVQTKTYDNELLYTWAFIPSVINILQSHLTSIHFMVACEFTADDNLCIHYFDKESRYGTKKSRLDRHIPDDFTLESIILPKKASKHLLHEIDKLCKESISSDSIYIERIESHLTLFATKSNFGKMKKRIDDLINNDQHGIFTIPVVDLKPRCLLVTSRHLLEAIEKDYIDDEIAIISLIGEDKFRAPAYLRSTIEQRVNTLLSQLATTSFKIENVNFASKSDFDSQLENIVQQHGCYFETSVKVKKSVITIANAFALPSSNTPRSIVTKDEALRSSNIMFQRATLSTGSVELHTGDPSTLDVDVIIISSVLSSIRDTILDCAGTKITTEFENAVNRNEQLIITDGGNLPCKKIIFVNFPAVQGDSMKTIVSRYIKYSLKHLNIKCQSIAFLIGEGGLNIDGFNASIVDDIKELFVKKQLTIKILFVLPSERSDLLKILQPYQTEEDGYAKLHYSRTKFRITLVSSNRETLAACETSIKTSAKQITTTKKGNIKLWDQYIINAYYKFCIDYFVLPNFNFDHQCIELTGTVDAITNAELLFDLEMERITHPPPSIVKKLKITKEQKRMYQALLERQIQLDSEKNIVAKTKAKQALRDTLKEHGKDVGDRLLYLQRWVRNCPRITIKNIAPLSLTGDFNDAQFILPADIAADPAKYLRPWLSDWVPMDFSGTPSDIHRRNLVLSDSLTYDECHDNFAQTCAADRTSFLITSIEENNPVWAIRVGSIDDGGLRAEEELQKLAAREDPVEMSKRREKFDKKFRTRVTEDQFALYQHFAYRVAENTTEFERFCCDFEKKKLNST